MTIENKTVIALMSALIYSSSKTLRPEECVKVAEEIWDEVERIYPTYNLETGAPERVYPAYSSIEPERLCECGHTCDSHDRISGCVVCSCLSFQVKTPEKPLKGEDVCPHCGRQR